MIKIKVKGSWIVKGRGGYGWLHLWWMFYLKDNSRIGIFQLERGQKPGKELERVKYEHALFVGIGQIYNGQIGKGIAFMIIGALFLFMIIVLVGIVLYPLFWIFNIYDAYTTAEKINKGKIKV